MLTQRKFQRFSSFSQILLHKLNVLTRPKEMFPTTEIVYNAMEYTPVIGHTNSSNSGMDVAINWVMYSGSNALNLLNML